MVDQTSTATQAENEPDPESHMEHPIIIEGKTKPLYTCYWRTVDNPARVYFKNVFLKTPDMSPEGHFLLPLPPVTYRLEGFATLNLDETGTKPFPSFSPTWDYLYAEIPVRNDDGNIDWIKVDTALLKNKEVVDLLVRESLEVIPAAFLVLPWEMQHQKRRPTTQEAIDFGATQIDKLAINRRRMATEPKITLAEIAKLSGISIAGVWKLEAGEVKNPAPATLAAVESALSTLEQQRQAAETGQTA